MVGELYEEPLRIAPRAILRTRWFLDLISLSLISPEVARKINQITRKRETETAYLICSSEIAVSIF